MIMYSGEKPPPPAEPSPHCGRLDDHPEHPWRGVTGPHVCPGPPTITLCDRLAVEASVKAANRG